MARVHKYSILVTIVCLLSTHQLASVNRCLLTTFSKIIYVSYIWPNLVHGLRHYSIMGSEALPGIGGLLQRRLILGQPQFNLVISKHLLLNVYTIWSFHINLIISNIKKQNFDLASSLLVRPCQTPFEWESQP